MCIRDRAGDEDSSPPFDLVFLLGRALFSADMLEEAKDEFLKASSMEPNRPEPHIELFVTLDKLGEAKQATHHQKEAHRIIDHELGFEGKAVERLHQLANLYHRLGETKKAQKLLEKIVVYKPDFHRAHYELAKVLRDSGNYTKAYTHIKKADHLSPEETEISEFYEIVAADIGVYIEGVRPELPKAPPTWEVSETPKNILHVIETSLPHKPSGYTFRSHYLFSAQKVLGLNPSVCTRPGFPVDCGVYEYEKIDIIDLSLIHI